MRPHLVTGIPKHLNPVTRYGQATDPILTKRSKSPKWPYKVAKWLSDKITDWNAPSSKVATSFLGECETSTYAKLKKKPGLPRRNIRLSPFGGVKVEKRELFD